MTEEREEIIRMPEPAEPPVEPEYEVVEVPEAEAEPEEGEEVEDLSDMVSVSKEDVLGKKDGNVDVDTSDLTGLDDEDMDDLFGVSDEDIMGAAPEQSKPKTRIIRVRRTRKHYPSPPPSLRGIRY